MSIVFIESPGSPNRQYSSSSRLYSGFWFGFGLGLGDDGLGKYFGTGLKIAIFFGRNLFGDALEQWLVGIWGGLLLLEAIVFGHRPAPPIIALPLLARISFGSQFFHFRRGLKNFRLIF